MRHMTEGPPVWRPLIVHCTPMSYYATHDRGTFSPTVRLTATYGSLHTHIVSCDTWQRGLQSDSQLQFTAHSCRIMCHGTEGPSIWRPGYVVYDTYGYLTTEAARLAALIIKKKHLNLVLFAYSWQHNVCNISCNRWYTGSEVRAERLTPSITAPFYNAYPLETGAVLLRISFQFAR